MSGELVLITGTSGFVGYHTLALALESGYRARAVVRKESQIEEIKESLGSKLKDRVEFVVISNLAAKHVFDVLMEDVKYVFHIASPMNNPTDDYERDYFLPAIGITVNILSAAAKSPIVKRVVITSSITPLISIPEYVSGVLRGGTHGSDDETQHYDIKTQFPHPMLVYAASKSMALDAAEEWTKSNKPAFDTSEDFISGTNAPLIKQLLGEKAAEPRLGSTVSINDVAKVHVLALKPSVPAGRYLVATDGFKWTDANTIVKENFPEEIGKSFSADGEAAMIAINIDSEKTQKAFGVKFQSFQEQVKDTVQSYLALS